MKGLAFVLSLAVVAAMGFQGPEATVKRPVTQRPYLNLAENCPKSGELVIGTKKVCYYACSGGSLVKEVGALELCLGSMGG